MLWIGNSEIMKRKILNIDRVSMLSTKPHIDIQIFSEPQIDIQIFWRKLDTRENDSSDTASLPEDHLSMYAQVNPSSKEYQ